MKKEEKSLIVWLRETVGNEKISILFLLFVQILLGGSSIWYAVLLRRLIDQAVSKNVEGFSDAVMHVILLVACQIGLRAFGRFLDEWSRASLENRFKKRLFSELLHKDYAQVTGIHSGEWMNRLTSDTVVAANGLTQIIPGAAGMLIKIAGAFYVIWLFDPGFAALLIFGGGVLLLITGAFRGILKRLHKQVQEADGDVRIFLQERLESQIVIRTFVREKWTERAASGRMETHKRMRMRRNHFTNLCNVGFGIGVHGAYILGAVYCSYGILKGTMSYGTLMAIVQLIGQLQTPIAGITGFLPQYYAMLASLERLREAESFTDDDKDSKSQREIGRFYHEDMKKIVFENVSFIYNLPVCEKGIRPPAVLENLFFEIDKGDYVALTGSSGGGKSTLLKLFLCLYPINSGTRYFVGKEKTTITAAWRGLFAYVPQGNQLLSGTIREIVTFGDEERMKNEEELGQALKLACADEFITKLEQGIDTMLGEHGTGLSEGQIQRIAIARAIFSERPILLLDESTSALDEETEERLLMNLKHMTDRTVLIVTHRPKALSICNKQMIFQNCSVCMRNVISQCQENETMK